MSSKIKNLYSQLDDASRKQMKLEDISKLRAQTNPYNTSIKEGEGNFLCFSYTAPHKEYLQKFYTTAMVAFVRTCLNEWKVAEDMPVVDVYQYAQNPGVIRELTAKWDQNPKLQQRVEEYEELMKKKLIVAEFFEEYFQYDPDKHVRSGYVPPVDGEDSRQHIHTPAAILAVKKEIQQDPKFKSKIALLEHPRMQRLLNMATKANPTNAAKPYTTTRLNYVANPSTNVTKYLKYNEGSADPNIPLSVYELIPPADTFSRFTRYVETNYEALHDAVHHLYVELNDIDFAILPAYWAPTLKQANDLAEKHKDSLTLPLSVASSGKWNIIAPYKANREVSTYVSKDALLLKRMMQEREKDAKLVKQMTERKAVAAKKKNNAEEGPDAKMLAQYKNFKQAEFEEMGVKSIDEDILMDDLPDDKVEIPVFRISKGGLKMVKDKIILDADNLPQ